MTAKSLQDFLSIDDKTKEESIVFGLNLTQEKVDDPSTCQHFVQLKCKEFYSNGKQMKMIQIVDVTHHILYTEYKAKIEFTSMINATVSHELRNPLNSIMAKNIEKEALYGELKSRFLQFAQLFKENAQF